GPACSVLSILRDGWAIQSISVAARSSMVRRASTIPRVIGATQRRGKSGSDGVGGSTQLGRLLPQAQDLHRRGVAARLPLVVEAFVVVEVDVLPAEQERDVELGQFDQEAGPARTGTGQTLLAPGKD